MRKLVLVLACIAVLFGGVASTPLATAGDNAAVALNLKDGSSDFRLAFKITRVNTDVVDTGNAAVAVASCSDCQTVAVALQAVLIFSDARVITPTNFAFAYNLECDNCYTLATAYQFVKTTGVVRFTAAGNQRIAAIRQELQSLRHSSLSIEEIQARVDALAAELLDVMKTELVGVGQAQTTTASTDTAQTASPTATTTSPDPAATEPTAPAPTDSTSDTGTPTDTTSTTPTDALTTDPASTTTTDSSAGTTTDSSGTTTTDGTTTSP